MPTYRITLYVESAFPMDVMCDEVEQREYIFLGQVVDAEVCEITP